MTFFRPLLTLVDFIVPGPVDASITTHIAMLHTVFNLSNTIIFLPFTSQLAHLTEHLIRPKSNETPDVYHLDFADPGLKGNATAFLIRAEKEILQHSNVLYSIDIQCCWRSYMLLIA